MIAWKRRANDSGMVLAVLFSNCDELRWRMGLELCHFDSEVAALFLEFFQEPHVAAIPMVPEQQPDCVGHCFYSDEALLPLHSQLFPGAEVGARSSQLGP